MVMACWNMFIPYLVPDLPANQKEALAYGVKGPLVYTSVAVKNWTAFQKLGVASTSTRRRCTTPACALAEAVSLGDLQHPQSPDEPIVLHLTRYPMCAWEAAQGAAPNRPRRSAERELRDVRAEHSRSAGAECSAKGGFDPARDIVAITVNRWPHGYAYTYNPLVRSDGVGLHVERPASLRRRRASRIGLITIANSDAAASPHTDAAMLEAHRAVQEVLQRRALPLLGDD